MEDSSMKSVSYPGKLERVFQDKCARTLISCYVKEVVEKYNKDFQ